MIFAFVHFLIPDVEESFLIRRFILRTLTIFLSFEIPVIFAFSSSFGQPLCL